MKKLLFIVTPTLALLPVVYAQANFGGWGMMGGGGYGYYNMMNSGGLFLMSLSGFLFLALFSFIFSVIFWGVYKWLIEDMKPKKINNKK